MKSKEQSTETDPGPNKRILSILGGNEYIQKNTAHTWTILIEIQ